LEELPRGRGSVGRAEWRLQEAPTDELTALAVGNAAGDAGEDDRGMEFRQCGVQMAMEASFKHGGGGRE
jgi:hypothetical protein